ARFTWDATGPNSSGFGSGSYDLFRYFENEDTARCRAHASIDDADRSWVSGMWWGGSSRAGEGIALDRRSEGTTFFAWYTHRPASMAGIDASQVGTQYWIAGDAKFSGRVLQIDGAYSATGTSFGPTLRFSDMTIKRWGSVRFELVSCTEARFTWDST